jgi:hypothetical protein
MRISANDLSSFLAMAITKRTNKASCKSKTLCLLFAVSLVSIVRIVRNDAGLFVASKGQIRGSQVEEVVQNEDTRVDASNLAMSEQDIELDVEVQMELDELESESRGGQEGLVDVASDATQGEQETVNEQETAYSDGNTQEGQVTYFVNNGESVSTQDNTPKSAAIDSDTAEQANVAAESAITENVVYEAQVTEFEEVASDGVTQEQQEVIASPVDAQVVEGSPQDSATEVAAVDNVAAEQENVETEPVATDITPSEPQVSEAEVVEGESAAQDQQEVIANPVDSQGVEDSLEDSTAEATVVDNVTAEQVNTEVEPVATDSTPSEPQVSEAEVVEGESAAQDQQEVIANPVDSQGVEDSLEDSTAEATVVDNVSAEQVNTEAEPVATDNTPSEQSTGEAEPAEGESATQEQQDAAAGPVDAQVIEGSPEDSTAEATVVDSITDTTQDQDTRNLSDNLVSADTLLTDSTINSTETLDRICHPWTYNSDEWWTHHVDWEVVLENDTHYCFEEMPPSPRRHYLREMYKNQYQFTADGSPNCSQVLSVRMWSSGWGSAISNVISGLHNGLNMHQPVQTAYNPVEPGWGYSILVDGSKAACPLKDQFCYFLNYTHCEANSSSFNEELPYSYDFLRKPFMWATEYATRPQTWLRKAVYDYYKEHFDVQTPCSAIHVRRGDVVLDGDGSRKYHAIDEYMNGTLVLDPNILLLTDDANAIAEAKFKYPGYNWMYENRTRYKAEEGGWGSHFPSGDPSLEVTILLATFKAVQQCTKLVRSLGNLGDYFEGLMSTRHEGNITVFHLDFHNPDVNLTIADTIALSRSDWESA